MPSRDPVLLGTVRRGLNGVEEVIDDIWSLAHDGSMQARDQQINLLRRAPCAREGDELKTLYHDINRTRPYIPYSNQRFTNYITTTVGNDYGRISRIRKTTQSDRDRY